MNNEIRIKTPVGTLHAYPSTDPDYPGIYIDLERGPKKYSAPLLMLDFTHTEYPECQSPGTAEKGILVCRCWGDVRREEYDTKVIFEGYDELFEK